MFGQWASLGGFGQPAGGGMGNQQMGWTAPGGGMPTWKLGGGMSAGGMGVYSPQLMAMLQQRLAMMRGGMPSSGGFSGIAAQPMPTMPANPGAFTQYQPPPIQAQPMPVQPAPAPAPVQPAPMPVATPQRTAETARLERRRLGQGYWAMK